jgi:hypothetical protein
MKTDDNPHPPIKAGDLLFAVGPGNSPPRNATDLLVYSTVVKAVRQEGTVSATHPKNAWLAIELGGDRPHLGFPYWIYKSYEIGINVHRSRAAALRAFAEQARRRLDKAEHERDKADKEVQWALTAAEQPTEVLP